MLAYEERSHRKGQVDYGFNRLQKTLAFQLIPPLELSVSTGLFHDKDRAAEDSVKLSTEYYQTRLLFYFDVDSQVAIHIKRYFKKV